MDRHYHRTTASDRAAIAGLVHQLDQKQIVVVSSTLIKTEVLEADMTDQQKYIFQSVIKKRSVVQIKDPAGPIMEIAAEIRNYYKQRKNVSLNKVGKVPSTPDAIHLATAIYYECDIFFTFDDGILGLVNPIAEKYMINISKPYVDQGGLQV